MDYRHTQTSITAILVAAGALILFVVIAASSEDDPTGRLVLAGFMIVITGAAMLFNRLKVVVAGGVVDAAFGFGWPKRTIEVRDIVAARQVRNKWYYGWGIRKVPGGWMYNVWGLDAVEIDLRSGSKFRIGTDDAADLLAAISLHGALRPTSD